MLSPVKLGRDGSCCARRAVDNGSIGAATGIGEGITALGPGTWLLTGVCELAIIPRWGFGVKQDAFTLRSPPLPRWPILEVGANGPGTICPTLRWCWQVSLILAAPSGHQSSHESYHQRLHHQVWAVLSREAPSVSFPSCSYLQPLSAPSANSSRRLSTVCSRASPRVPAPAPRSRCSRRWTSLTSRASNLRVSSAIAWRRLSSAPGCRRRSCPSSGRRAARC
jgi:hypothetical protein